MTGGRRGPVLPVLLLAVIVNLPLAHSIWADSRADGPGTGIVVVTAIADAVVVVIALLLSRFGGPRRRAALRAVALEDVQRCAPELLLERLQGEDYLIRGEVQDLGPGALVLDLGNRTVEVLLDGHANPVGLQQPAQVRARLIS